MNKVFILVTMLILQIALPSCKNDGQVKNENLSQTTPTEELSSFSQDGTQQISPQFAKGQAPDKFQVKINTSKGTFTVECHREWAPIGVDRFFNLVRQKFYHSAKFFRVIPGFVVQFGIHPNPEISKLWLNARIKDDPVKTSNTVGTLSFAMAGQNTRTTQLFINLADNNRLDQMGFSPICRVISGMNTVEKFNSQYQEAPSQLQSRIHQEGNSFLEKEFPGLDFIGTMEILPQPVQKP